MITKYMIVARTIIYNSERFGQNTASQSIVHSMSVIARLPRLLTLAYSDHGVASTLARAIKGCAHIGRNNAASSNPLQPRACVAACDPAPWHIGLEDVAAVARPLARVLASGKWQRDEFRARAVT